MQCSRSSSIVVNNEIFIVSIQQTMLFLVIRLVSRHLVLELRLWVQLVLGTNSQSISY